MNLEFAREVGFVRYIWRRTLWRLVPPEAMLLPTGVRFPTPRDNFFASDCFVTEANVDWCSEFLLAAFLKAHGANREFLDVGAHIGYYSCLLAPLVRKVYAFEPDPRNVPSLQHALACLENAELVLMAVSDRRGFLKLSVSDASSVSHLVLDHEEGVEVTTTSLDAIVKERGLDPVGIKMDIEGYEILALEGCRAVIETHAPVFLVEFNLDENSPNSWQGLDRFLHTHGYTLFAVTRRPKGLSDYDYQFRKYSIDDIKSLSFKMLFLVPPTHVAWFEGRSSKFCGRDLRPRAVRRFLRKHLVINRQGA